MFDIGAAELLVIVVVAILVIGPKDMPHALRTVGRWIGKMRRMSSHFRSGMDAMIREAELEESEREWRDRNAKIMAQPASGEPAPAMEPLAQSDGSESRPPEGADTQFAETQPTDGDVRAEAAVARATAKDAGDKPAHEGEPELPLIAAPSAPKSDRT